MSELELANLVGSIYDAGSGSGDWIDVDDRMSRVLGGHRSHIWIVETDGSRSLVTRANPDGIGPYLAHFQKLDPHLAFAREHSEREAACQRRQGRSGDHRRACVSQERILQ